FMLLGVLLALFYRPDSFAWQSVRALALGLIATCLIASSNYVLNELLDAKTDRMHPVKRHRPVPSGLVDTDLARAEWLALGAVGLLVAFGVNRSFGATGLALWVMGVV